MLEGSGLLVRPDAAQYSKRRIVPPVGDLSEDARQGPEAGKDRLMGLWSDSTTETMLPLW
jgi:hypothetical protein